MTRTPLQRLGRLAAGSAMASANRMAETFHLGVGTAAKVFGSAAAAGEGVVPGAGLARGLAAAVGEEAARGAGVARRLAAESWTWTGEPNAEPAAGPGRAWAELAADTTLAPWRSLASAAVSLGAETLRATAATSPGQAALDGFLDGLNGDPAHFTVFDAGERRRSFVAVATDSGAAAARESFALAEAAARLAFGDAGPLRGRIEAGLDEMRRLSASADMQELLPAPMVSERLQRRAGLIVDRAPERFLEALAGGAGGDSPRPLEILKATVEDAANLRVFLVLYPQVLTLVGTDLGQLLIAGSISFSELEAFLEGRRSGAERAEEACRSRPDRTLSPGNKACLSLDRTLSALNKV